MFVKISIPAFWRRGLPHEGRLAPHLPRLLLAPRYQPRFVKECPVTQSLIPLLDLVDWEQLPTTLDNKRTGGRVVPVAAYVGAYLVKLEQRLPTFGELYRFLRQHPALVWALGFPLVTDLRQPYGFDLEAALPTQRHFSRKLSEIPNEVLQNLLDAQVNWLKGRCSADFGHVVALDTKHIVAWVKENNPKAYVKEGRFQKEKQPLGDPDCKLGCKRRRNQVTPTKEGQPVNEKVSVGEFYWGYASGVVVTKVADVGEFVLAEVTQTFDHADATYFFPLHPTATGQCCPINHAKWSRGGCTLVMPTVVGARIRHELDRESETYKAVYRQRTAVERIFSQAVALGIERPKLRTQSAIANQNSLIYVLLNLRALQRVLAKKGHA